MPLNHQDEDREDRARRHEEYVQAKFAAETLPEGMTAWSHGLMIVFTTGGASDRGRIHRASCPSISKVANATTYKKNGGTYTLGPDGIRRGALRCQTCGTTDLPVGAHYWGDTADIVARRERDRARASRVRDFQRAMDSQAHTAHNLAVAEVLAKYSVEVDALAAQHLARLQDEVRARFADVADTLPE